MFQLAALALAGVGTGISIFGAQSAAAAQKKITAGERAVEAQRKQAMELDARRKMLEVFRNQQRARSMALTTATAQGAAQGSGLAGAYGQVAGQSGVNLLGISQNLGIGRNIFDINADISQAKMDMAQAQAWSATGASLTNLGGSLVSNFGAINRASNQFLGFPLAPPKPQNLPQGTAFTPYGPGY